MVYSKKITHWINDREVRGKHSFSKVNPATGEAISTVYGGDGKDVERAIITTEKAFPLWAGTPVVKRAEMLREAALMMRAKKDELAAIIALECGKSKKDALSEVGAAIECGLFITGLGRGVWGEILPSAVLNRRIELRRVPIGVGALITPFNNPGAGVAWKLFPALLSGNAVIIKSHRDVPSVAIWYAKLFKEVGLPPGVISVLQGTGREIGDPLVADARVRFVSFTGSVKTGQTILKATADRLAKVSIEAGGKNPFVVCDDADLERAATLAVQGSFVDAGQRCAATSRIIVFDAVYEKFKKLFLAKVQKLKVGTADTDDYGAIVNEGRLKEILKEVEGARRRGAKVITGGERFTDEAHRRGFFMAPTVLENVKPTDEISRAEIFGPVVILYRVKDFERAVALANDSDFKLTGAIHTRDMHCAEEFVRRYEAGVVRVNGSTHGSEPHVPFGGVGLSGNGWREPGKQSLDFYSEWKQVSVDI